MNEYVSLHQGVVSAFPPCIILWQYIVMLLNPYLLLQGMKSYAKVNEGKYWCEAFSKSRSLSPMVVIMIVYSMKL